VSRGREVDDLAKELLIDVAEDVGRDDGERIRGEQCAGVVQAPDDVLNGLVGNIEIEREVVRRLGAVGIGFLPGAGKWKMPEL